MAMKNEEVEAAVAFITRRGAAENEWDEEEAR